ncbi:MAG TPA: hypothetical protein VHZ76_01665 [Gammaproteobacteria bacterium]|jgi:TPR repeat protein|nr:hypothetical protein [Gammaproteobacteria bacterium]
MWKQLIISTCILSLAACGTPSPRVASELQQGKRLFEDGYYKRSLQELLPLACDGNAEAQYAVGYMYYYGYGVPQDTDVGYFWIKRSADQHFLPAEKALSMMGKNTKNGRL